MAIVMLLKKNKKSKKNWSERQYKEKSRRIESHRPLSSEILDKCRYKNFKDKFILYYWFFSIITKKFSVNIFLNYNVILFVMTMRNKNHK